MSRKFDCESLSYDTQFDKVLENHFIECEKSLKENEKLYFGRKSEENQKSTENQELENENEDNTVSQILRKLETGDKSICENLNDESFKETHENGVLNKSLVDGTLYESFKVSSQHSAPLHSAKEESSDAFYSLNGSSANSTENRKSHEKTSPNESSEAKIHESILYKSISTVPLIPNNVSTESNESIEKLNADCDSSIVANDPQKDQVPHFECTEEEDYEDDERVIASSQNLNQSYISKIRSRTSHNSVEVEGKL